MSGPISKFSQYKEHKTGLSVSPYVDAVANARAASRREQERNQWLKGLNAKDEYTADLKLDAEITNNIDAALLAELNKYSTGRLLAGTTADLTGWGLLSAAFPAPTALYFAGEGLMNYYGPEGKKRTKELDRGIDRRDGDPVINSMIESGELSYPDDFGLTYLAEMKNKRFWSNIGDDLSLVLIAPMLRFKLAKIGKPSSNTLLKASKMLPSYIEDAVVAKRGGGKMNYLNYVR